MYDTNNFIGQEKKEILNLNLCIFFQQMFQIHQGKSYQA